MGSTQASERTYSIYVIPTDEEHNSELISIYYIIS